MNAHRTALALAWRHLSYHGVRSAILILALTIAVALPVVLSAVVTRGEAATVARAQTTPWLLGAPGSAVDLVLGALWFTDEPLRRIQESEATFIRESGLADAIELNLGAHASGHSVVGTAIDYLAFRNLHVVDGRAFALPGECVLGADAAAVLGLVPGDTILTDPEDLFDIAGSYPLRMRVVGVLAPNSSPDDRAVFCDLQTTWVIEGHGHAHVDLEETNDPNVRMPSIETQDGRPVASAALSTATELTAEAIRSLHFHGDRGDLPIDAVIVLPHTPKSATILAGRIDQRPAVHLVKPPDVVREVLQGVFRVGALLSGVLLATGLATIALVALVLVLSMRLRSDELETFRRIGMPRSATATLLLGEVAMLFLGAIFGAFVLVELSRLLPAEFILRLAG